MATLDSLTDIKLDPSTWDIALQPNSTGKYDVVLLTGAARVRQAICVKLKTWFQEWAFDTTIGIPYLEQFFVKNPNLPNIESLLRTQIMTVPGVSSLPTLSCTVNARERSLTVSFTAVTPYGNIADIIPMEQQGEH